VRLVATTAGKERGGEGGQIQGEKKRKGNHLGEQCAIDPLSVHVGEEKKLSPIFFCSGRGGGRKKKKKQSGKKK